MENENVYRQEMVNKYRDAMKDMFRYIPWLEQKAGSKMVHIYSGDNRPDNSVPIPVYDGTLLGFVKDMQRTGLMDRNYRYVFSRKNITSEKDEIRVIDETEFKEIEVIFGIMAKYVLGGMTKGMLWPSAVENGVFLHGLKRIKELLDIWDEPLA